MIENELVNLMGRVFAVVFVAALVVRTLNAMMGRS